MNLSFDQLPRTLEEILNVPYEGEDKTGSRYLIKENQLITGFMLEGNGLIRDGKGKYGKKSGHSKKDLMDLLDRSFPKECYHDRDKFGNPLHMRSRSAIDCQITRIVLPEFVIALMAYYANIQPEGAMNRQVWHDILVERVRLSNLGIHKITLGDYSPVRVDSPIIIRDDLTQKEIDVLEMVQTTYKDYLKLNLKTRAQWEEQLAKKKSEEVQ